MGIRHQPVLKESVQLFVFTSHLKLGEKKEPRNIWKGKFSTLLNINIMPNKEKAYY
jgi:hypothetical protein